MKHPSEEKELEEILGALSGGMAGMNGQPKFNGDADAEIKKLYEIFKETELDDHGFTAGDIVTIAPYAPYSQPLPGQPAIVVETLNPPVFDANEGSSSAHFRRKLDVIIGVVTNGTFVTFHQESRFLSLLREFDPRYLEGSEG